jgi:hypothetical protein
MVGDGEEWRWWDGQVALGPLALDSPRGARSAPSSVPVPDLCMVPALGCVSVFVTHAVRSCVLVVCNN